MKIRNSLAGGIERKVFIYENKKEEYFMAAIPSLNWSSDFTYETADLREMLKDSLQGSGLEEAEAEEISACIYNWTREM
ncbi:YueH family protein [Bacillus sp. AK031]